MHRRPISAAELDRGHPGRFAPRSDAGSADPTTPRNTRLGVTSTGTSHATVEPRFLQHFFVDWSVRGWFIPAVSSRGAGPSPTVLAGWFCAVELLVGWKWLSGGVEPGWPWPLVHPRGFGGSSRRGAGWVLPSTGDWLHLAALWSVACSHRPVGPARRSGSA